MNVLILYSKGPSEITNRKSALGSYIHCLGFLLHAEFDIHLNGVKLSEIGINKENPTVKKQSVLKSLIPEIVKSGRRIQRIRKNNIKLVNSILHSKIKYDVIIEFYSAFSDSGRQLSMQSKIPLITVLDAPVADEDRFFHRKTFSTKKILRLEKESLNSSKTIVTYNEPMRQYAERFKNSSATVMIHQNIDFTRYRLVEANRSEPPYKFCFIGSFLKWHQVDFLIECFNEIAGLNPKVELYLVGSGMMLEEIRSITEKSRFKDKIHFTGYLDGEELEKLKSEMHFGVMPGSNWYGVPNKIFEYGISGMPVLAPATPAIKDVFGEINGIYLFVENDKKDFLKQVDRLLKDYMTNKELSMQISTYFNLNFNQDKTLTFYRNLILSAINR